MSETVAAHASAPEVAQALALTHELETMLEDEFELLKAQKLDDFDALQTSKVDLLRQLTHITGIDGPGSADALGPEWDEFKHRMLECRNKHRRNEVLITRKIDAIRGALQSLEVQDPTSSVEIYDRLGKLSRVRRGRGYNEA